MEINLIAFEENPSGYIQNCGKGRTAYEWLVSTFGLAATVKIFTDMVRDRTDREDTNSPIVTVGHEWIRSEDIDSIACWEETPQGHTFWSILSNELDDGHRLTYAEIELVANAIYSDKPLTPEDV